MDTRTRWIVRTATVATASLALVACGHTAAASGWKEWDRSQVNAIRHSHNLAPVLTRKSLQQRAQEWAHFIAYHKIADDTNDRACWRIGGDYHGSNVGRGHSVRQVERLLEQSRPHFANMVDPDYSLIGVGIETATSGEYAGYTVVVQEFCG